MISSLISLLALILTVRSQSPECPESKAPSQLAAVTVWTREHDGATSYRISDEDLASEGYQRGSTDRQDIVTMLARSPESCTLGPCTLQLSTNSRESDGAISHQENVLGTPEGFTDLGDSFYCARRFGDCGAQLPVFRFTKGSGSAMAYAYSLDPAATFPGYSREGKILCYGWSDNGSVVHPISPDSKGCLHLNSIANGKITYSTTRSAIYPVGTTATLVCDEGYLGGGQSAVLCVKSGWYPASGLGYCVRQNVTQLNSGTALAVSSASLVCAALGPVQNGQLIYSGIAVGGRFPKGTRASVLCNLGYEPFGPADSICEGGKWSRKVATCESTAEPKCPSLKPPSGGRVMYSSIAPYGPSTTATLSCDLGLSVSGASLLQCTEDGWSPKAFGECKQVCLLRGTRVNLIHSRQCAQPLTSTGVGCTAANVIGGTTSYIQANAAVPYSSGTTVFIMCNLGYTSQGSMSSLCQNGVWTPTLGTCTPSTSILAGTGSTTGQTCPALFAPLGGTVSYSTGSTFGPFNYGTTATLQCTNGFPQGSASSTCINGQWTPTLGTCSSTGVNSGNAGGTCTALTTPMFGTVSYTPTGSFGSYTTGTTAILSCNLGYTVSGSSTSTCSNGAWIPSVLGSCIQGLGGLGTNSILECMNPTVLNGMVTYSQGSTFDVDRPSGTVATLMCNAGFSPSGSTTATCQSGSWIPTLGMCTSSSGLFPGTSGQTCTALFAPLGGTVSYSTGNTFGPFNYGTVATLRCNSGFPQGASSATCLNGQWSPTSLGTCSSTGGTSGLTCNSLFAPIGGTLIYSSSTPPYQSGTTVTLQCSSGTVSGSSMSTCSNGQWTPTIGTCSGFPGGTTGTTCNAMMTPSGATLSYSNGAIFGPFNSGTTVTMTCMSGTPSGTTMATCLNGQWSPSTLGTCPSSIIGGGIGGQCPALTAPSGGTLTMSSGFPGSPASSGTVATLYCPSGVLGTSSVLCSNGAWTPPTLGTCIGSTGTGTGTSCQSAPTTPLGATLSYSNFAIFPPYPSGTTVTARCLSGAMISGTSTATCQNGQWQPSTLGSCDGTGTGSGLTCPSVQQVGGTVDYSDGPFSTAHPSGSTATLLCNSGVPIGSALSTCQNGQWVPAIGSCSTTGIGTTGQCTIAPTAPFGATLTYSSGGMFGPWNSGTTATMTCPFGQTVVGGVTSTCSNGFWTALGTCSASGSNGTGGVAASPPCYLGILAPSHGNITYSNSPPYPSGTIATLTCSTGYTVTGASTSNCTSGSFSPIGTCQ
ncbi:hypothetical protein Y032_0011g1302 [Ancylostoma ceylanicum]|nr:hypothetical protein Y032_0011g1302 [Ancylostoma ceylanicum]